MRKVDSVVAIGNQIPTSISDVLNCEVKYKLQDHKLVKVLDVADVYAEVDWTQPVPSNKQFIRITGTAEASQAAEVTEAIAFAREHSDAFVISNAVSIQECDNGNVQTIEDIHKFDLMSTLKEHLTEAEYRKVAAL
jgi:flavin-binding protein dodecin